VLILLDLVAKKSLLRGLTLRNNRYFFQKLTLYQKTEFSTKYLNF